MKLTTDKHPILDLSKQHGVIDVFCTNSLRKQITINLTCKQGSEQDVAENLPKWVHDEMIVIKSPGVVILQAKKQ